MLLSMHTTVLTAACDALVKFRKPALAPSPQPSGPYHAAIARLEPAEPACRPAFAKLLSRNYAIFDVDLE